MGLLEEHWTSLISGELSLEATVVIIEAVGHISPGTVR